MVCCFFIAVNYCSNAQPVKDYRPFINSVYSNINRYFYDAGNKLYYEECVQGEKQTHSFLWPLCALIQAANEASVINPSVNYIQPVVDAIDQYYTTATSLPSYQASVVKEKKDDAFYDDNQWIAIAYIDIYNREHEKKYLDAAVMIYDFMMTGYDSAAGGGLYWKYADKTTKNTCSNGPGILVALQLYKITNDNKYLQTALQLYNWVNAHLQSPDGLYYDNIKIPSLKIDSAKYTYNTGTMLQSNVLLYNITHDKKYLQRAESMAAAATNFFYKNNKLPGHYWFNAVMLRGYIELYNVNHDKQLLHLWYNEAERIWRDEKNTNGLLGHNARKKSLIDQAAMVEVYARLQAVN
ncbi:Glycosyl hydrolase family 76 [Parafilimonas terrae]|uniref:Glycosyl hydrolase family 76 n=1 Tax=Parafilimonas terrae TaxID=1465490 RepID=A0A1I5WV47_9BACT|nr:Glycosyl hydrolase family 76 [Parafilimonas terrae]